MTYTPEQIREMLDAATPGPLEWIGGLEQIGADYKTVIDTEVSCGMYCSGGQWSPSMNIGAGDRTLFANAYVVIDQLLAENARLRGALEEIAESDHPRGRLATYSEGDRTNAGTSALRHIARAALGDGQ